MGTSCTQFASALVSGDFCCLAVEKFKLVRINSQIASHIISDRSYIQQFSLIDLATTISSLMIFQTKYVFFALLARETFYFILL